ncbi:MAG: hypothetical protein ABEI32_05040 [Halothece sp.]
MALKRELTFYIEVVSGRIDVINAIKAINPTVFLLYGVWLCSYQPT